MCSSDLTMVLLFAAGWLLTAAFSTLNSLVQENAPAELKGRVLSIYQLAFRGGMPLGSLAAGALVRPFGVSAVIGVACVALATLTLGALAWNARLRHL